jgi:TolA-binding protein
MLDKAAINYLKGYKQFPKGAKASDSLLKLALTLGELKKKTEACSMLSRLETEFPNRPATSIKRTKDAKVKFGCKQ